MPLLCRQRESDAAHAGGRGVGATGVSGAGSDAAAAAAAIHGLAGTDEAGSGGDD